jgi:hypothetical protein
MHELSASKRFDPLPPNAFESDAEHRQAANRALVLSALGLTLTGGIESPSLSAADRWASSAMPCTTCRCVDLAGGLRRLPGLAPTLVLAAYGQPASPWHSRRGRICHSESDGGMISAWSRRPRIQPNRGGFVQRASHRVSP